MPGSPRAGPVHGEQSGKGPVSYKLALAMGFPGGSVGKESAHNAGALGWEDPLEKGMATPPVFLPGESLRLYSPWGHKESRT